MEWNYNIYNNELLAIVGALEEYLCSTPQRSEIFTDHKMTSISGLRANRINIRLGGLCFCQNLTSLWCIAQMKFQENKMHYHKGLIMMMEAMIMKAKTYWVTETKSN